MKSKTLKDNTHPIVLQVRINKRTKRKNTPYSATPKEFHDGFFTPNREGYRELNEKIDGWLNSLRNCSTHEDCFAVLVSSGSDSSFSNLIQTMLTELKAQGRMATWMKTRDLLKSMSNYKTPTLQGIDYTYLKGYETHLLSGGCSGGGVKGYIRTLKVIVNEAIKRGLLSPSLYPFKNSMNPQGYSTKHLKSSNKPRPVTINALEAIKNNKGRNKAIDDARMYWLLSYYLCGMNLKDLVYLTWSDVGDFISIRRKKTGHSLQVPVHSEARKILTALTENGRYILPVITVQHDTAVQRYNRLRYINRKINDGLAEFAKEHGLEKFTMYQARFTIATHLLHKGVDIAKNSQLLAHQSVTITQVYLGKYAMDDTRDVSDLL